MPTESTITHDPPGGYLYASDTPSAAVETCPNTGPSRGRTPVRGGSTRPSPRGASPHPALPFDGLDERYADAADERQRAAARLEAERRARARARRRAYEHRRAQRRVEAGQFAAHPGRRHRRVYFAPRHSRDGRVVRGADPVVEALPEGLGVVTDQARALARVEELVDAELWRADHRATALGVLRGLVHAMDWETGLIAGLTRGRLAEAAGCSTRTVSRVLAWATHSNVALLACVEPGASAAHLGTTTNRAAAWAITAPPPKPEGSDRAPCSTPSEPSSAAGGDGSGNPPASCVRETTPRNDQGKNHLDKQNHDQPWPLWTPPCTPAERARASDRLLERIGLAGRLPHWRARGLLARWWQTEGACVAGLLHALDHHPDQPDTPRGDALRGARDPLAVLAWRLRPWQQRLHELPASLQPAHPRHPRTTALDAPAPRVHHQTSSPAVRAAARQMFTQRHQTATTTINRH